jgi:lysophospholipase L1-like esterase
MKNRILAFMVFFVSGAVSFIIAEVCLRMLGYHGGSGNVFNIRNTMLVDDAIINWRFKPGSVFYFNDIVYQINGRGFRDFVYTYGKRTNTYRIFLVSDSVGFGFKVQMNDSYPKILERRLNELQLPFRVEVINYSMPGLSIKQKLHLVELYAAQYEPDLIITDYVMNDIDDFVMDDVTSERRKDRKGERNERCSIALLGLPVPCFVETHLKGSAFFFLLKQSVENLLQKINWEDKPKSKGLYGADDYLHRLYTREDKRKYLKNVFRRIGKYQNDHHVPMLVPIFPVIYDFSKYRWKDIKEFIIELCNDNHLPYISLLDDFSKFNYNEMRVERGDFDHPSVKGNSVAAEAILQALLQRGLLKAADALL